MAQLKLEQLFTGPREDEVVVEEVTEAEWPPSASTQEPSPSRPQQEDSDDDDEEMEAKDAKDNAREFCIQNNLCSWHRSKSNSGFNPCYACVEYRVLCASNLPKWEMFHEGMTLTLTLTFDTL